MGERFLEAGEPKLMDHHDWGQEETEETQTDKENNIEGLIVNGEAAKERTIVKRIAVRDKVVKNLQHLFSDRVDLHANAYQHKTVKMFDLMYTDMWLLADEHIHVMGAKGPVNLSRACEDAQSLARLTDGWLIGQIANSTSEELKPARDLLRRVPFRASWCPVTLLLPRSPLTWGRAGTTPWRKLCSTRKEPWESATLSTLKSSRSIVQL